MAKKEIKNRFSGSINGIEFSDKRLYRAVLEIARKIEMDGNEITEELTAWIAGLFKELSKRTGLSYEKLAETGW